MGGGSRRNGVDRNGSIGVEGIFSASGVKSAEAENMLGTMEREFSLEVQLPVHCES